MSKTKDREFERLVRAFFKAGPPRPYEAWPLTRDALRFGYKYAMKRAKGVPDGRD